MSNYTTKIVLLIILLLAVFFRFWQIGQLPGGLFPDEAANGLDVNSILQGQVQPFYERGNGREALFFYFLAASAALFGRGPWQHHIVSAGFGFFAVLATYFLAKRLFNERVALLSAFFMAVSSYAVTMTRTAFRANTVPLLATLTILFLVKMLQTEKHSSKIWSGAGAGLCFALGFYTYPSFRMMIPLLGIMGIILLFGARGQIKRYFFEYRTPIMASIAVFLIAIAPLAMYFVKHPDSAFGRAGQVSVFSPDLNHGNLVGTVITVFEKTMFSFFTEGDLNWRHNIAGYPFLSPFLSPFFGVGMIVFSLALLWLLRQAWRKNLQKSAMALSLVGLWFWLMLAPEVATAEGIPHGLRLIGVIPAIFIIPAFIISWIWERFRAMSWMYNFKYVLAIIFFAGIFFYNFILYFGIAAGSSEYYYAFRSDLTSVSQYLNERNSPKQTYLALDKFSVQTVDYLATTTNQPYTLLDPAHAFEVKLKKGDQVVFTQSTIYDRLKFMKYHPSAKLIKTEKNQFGEIIMLVYQQP